MNEVLRHKTSMKLKIGYSFGQLSDSVPFNLFYIYFLYFITDVVGLPAVYGGIISLLVVMWDAITDPIVGYLSDNSRSPYGRRRPFMIVALVPLLICTILLFSTVHFSDTMTFVYYVVVGIMYWSCYKVFVIPYFALGAELTQDFNDRTTLRGIAGLGIYIAVWFTSAGPMVVLDRVLAAGGTESQSWFYSAIIFGTIGLLGGLICWRSTRGKELVHQTDYKVDKQGNLFTNYIELFRLKAYRRYLLMNLIYNVAFAIAMAAFVYIMDTNLSLNPAKQALYWTIYSILTIAFVPICNVLANKIGKKQAMIWLTAVSILGCFFYFFFGIPNFTHLIVFTALYNIGNVCYWSVGYSIMYDCAELDEFIFGKRREGAVTGFASFTQKFGSAIGMYVTGGLLTFFGYDGNAETQTQQAMDGIITVNTLVPGIIMVVGTIFIILYPITKERFQQLLLAIDAKKQGLPFEDDKIKVLFGKEYKRG